MHSFVQFMTEFWRLACNGSSGLFKQTAQGELYPEFVLGKLMMQTWGCMLLYYTFPQRYSAFILCFHVHFPSFPSFPPPFSSLLPSDWYPLCVADPLAQSFGPAMAHAPSRVHLQLMYICGVMVGKALYEGILIEPQVSVK